MSRTLAMLLGVTMTTGAHAAALPCVMSGQKPMVVAELFFGRDIRGRSPVTDSEWSEFVARVVAREFPDGFTVEDGDGAWRDSASGRVVHERAKILIVAAPHSDSLGRKLRTVVDAYRKDFHQTSVGLVTSEGCGAF